MQLLSPMLAEHTDPSMLTKFTDKAWAWEQKIDGQRVLVHVDGKSVMPVGRDGGYKRTNWSSDLAGEFAKLDGQYVFDGEVIAGKLWLFDMPCADGVLPTTAFKKRRAALSKLYKAWKPKHVALLPSYTTLEAKVSLARLLMTGGGEGIMVKHVDGAYRLGGRSSKMLKAKFVNDVDCIATDLRRGGKSNIVLSVYQDGELIEIGEVTALAGDGGQIKVGDVVTARYLYATINAKGNPRLYQPTYPKLRTDKAAEDCNVDQLIYCNKEIVSV